MADPVRAGGRAGAVDALPTAAAVLGAALVVAGLAVGDEQRVLVRALLFGLAAAAGAANLYRLDGGRRTPEFWVLVASCAAFAGANLARWTGRLRWGTDLNGLAAVLLLLAGVVFVRHVRPGRGAEIALDGLITGTVVAIAVRELAVIAGGPVDGGPALFMVVGLVGVSTWLRALVATGSMSLRLFALATALAVVANTAVVLGGLGPARPLAVDVWSLLSTAALVLALTRPDLDRVDAPQAVPGRMGVSRILLMALALAAAPAAMLVRTVSGRPPDLLLVAALTALAALWAARFAVVLNERHHHQRQLDAQLRTDPLTGVASRRLAVEVLDQRLGADRELAVLFIDLDGFKAVNDRHGHLVGDRLLHAVAQRFAAALRPEDLLARLSGDEFAVITDADPEALRARLVAALADPVAVQPGLSIEVAASIGLARTRPEDVGATDVLDRADRDMYARKGRRSRRSDADRR